MRNPTRRALGLLAALGLVSGGLAAGPVVAGAAAASAGCPVVNQSTGAVSPAPAPGVFWKFCDLSGANLSGADLAGASLYESGGTNVNLSGANLSGAFLDFWWGTATNWSGADMTGAELNWGQFGGNDLANADLDNANIQYAHLNGATVTGATWAGAYWFDTICPDGTNSDLYDDGCFSPLNTSTPTAHPVVEIGTPGSDGWYSSIQEVVWNWADSGPLATTDCTGDTWPPAGASGDPLTLTASCADLAGHTGNATFSADVDPGAPSVVVTGVRSSARYLYGRVPRAGCRTSESPSGVATGAHVKVTGGSSLHTGVYTATCSGAVTVAGVAQAAPEHATYSVVFGFGGFATPRAGSAVAKHSSWLKATFHLVTAAGKPIPAWLARRVSDADALLLQLTGPNLGSTGRSTLCGWNAGAGAFSCALSIPGNVKTGKSSRYHLALLEQVVTGWHEGAFIVAPAVHGVNPEVITFR
jgi:hypothetical protein